MNILFILHCPVIAYYGGIQRVTSILSEELQRRGHQVIFLSTNYRDNVTKEDENNINAKQKYIVDFSNNSFKEQYLLLLSKYEIQIIVCQSPTSKNLLLLKNTPKYIGRITCIHTRPFSYLGHEKFILKHSNPDDYKHKIIKSIGLLLPSLYSFLIRKKEENLYSNIDSLSEYICFLSKGNYSRFVKYCPSLDKDKLTYIANPNNFNSTTDFDISEKDNTILFVGRMSPEKDPWAFIDICEQLSKRRNSYNAIVVGDGCLLTNLKQYVKDRGLNNITFVGNQQDVSKFYKKASCICVTSISEGWGMVITEAMSLGCVPFCYDNFEAIHDIIDNEKDGFIIESNNKSEMVAKIDSFLNNKNKTMIQSAILKVRKFDVKNVVDSWEALFSKMTINKKNV